MTYTYFYKDYEKIKIGMTTDPVGRLKQGMTMNPDIVELRVLPFNIENKLHRLFKKYRLVGEWFIAEVVEEFLNGIDTSASEDEYLSYIDSFAEIVKSSTVMIPSEYMIEGALKGLIACIGLSPSSLKSHKKKRGCEYNYGNKRLAIAYVSAQEPKIKADKEYVFDAEMNLSMAAWVGIKNHIENILKW